MDITQFMWKHGDIPRKLWCMILVIITKGNMDTQGSGLLESLFKMVYPIINTRLRLSICLQDALNGFRTGRGTGTEILELNMAQELDIIDQDPMFLVFLYLCKAFGNVYCGHLLSVVEESGVGPCMCILFSVFWYQKEFVTCQKRVSWTTLQGNSGNHPGRTHLAHPV